MVTGEDQRIKCVDCGEEFLFTAGEQAFYASKNLMNPPSRCPTCRARARATRELGASAPRGQREFFPVVCSRCGVQTQVPFMPRNDRPVYCSSCFDLVRLDEGTMRSRGA